MSKGPKPYHEATRRTPARNGPLPGEWREPKYPGDAGLNLDVTQGDEMGMIRVQVYGPDSYMVASYTPGRSECFPGDTPKFVPDKSVWCKTRDEASRQFMTYVIGAFRAGWKPEKATT